MNHTTIHIPAGIFFKAALVALFFAILYMLRDLVLILLTSVVIASAIEPMTRWFSEFKIPRVITVILIYAFFILFLFGIFYFFLPPLFDEVSGFVASVPYYLEITGLSDFGKNMWGESAFVVEQFSGDFSLQETIQELQNAISGVSGSILRSVSHLFGGILGLILILVISFYLAVQEKGIEEFLRVVTPLKHERYIISLWNRSQMKIGRWMQGQLLLGLIVGVLVYLGLTIIGVKYALLLAVLAAVFELIPLFGPILAAIPAVIIGFLQGASAGFMVAGLYVIIQQFENHLIYPLVVRKVVGVSPILVIIALIVGGKLAGFLGLLLAVPVAAALMEFAGDIQRKKMEEEKRLAEEK